LSKIVLVCFKDRANKTITRSEINALSSRLVPDNISARPPVTVERGGLLAGIINPNSYLGFKDTSTYVGHITEPSGEWWKPLSPLPDGAYALFRSDDATVELATDMVASRTIWYVHTESMFIASTSQRAIVYFLRSFEPNEAALGWMLSSGCLGPDNSWDRRIKCLSPATSLRLDRKSWKVTCEENKPRFHPAQHTEPQFEKEMREALERTFAGLSLDYSKWVLLLSGGVDSREILMKLKDHQNLKSITWGLSSALTDKDNDAYVARQLAGHFGLSHQYFKLDPPAESIEKIFDRFIWAGEGRTDGVSGYLDGFQVWKSLFDADVLGVIRGDEAFGWLPVTSDAHARQSVGGWLFRDYVNLDAAGELITKQFGKQAWPGRLEREAGESLDTWRDRLYQEFRIPVVLAALAELKCSYIEVVTPFLSRTIVSLVRTMPDSLRTDKRLFKKIVISDSPDIPYARYSAIASPGGVFKSREVVGLFSDTLSSSYYRGLFSNDLVDYIVGKMRVATDAKVKDKLTLREIAKQLLPKRIKGLLKNTVVKPQLDHNLLAFRTYLGGKMCRMLADDAGAFPTGKDTG
jgi:hypothetical protein